MIDHCDPMLSDHNSSGAKIIYMSLERRNEQKLTGQFK